MLTNWLPWHRHDANLLGVDQPTSVLGASDSPKKHHPPGARQVQGEVFTFFKSLADIGRNGTTKRLDFSIAGGRAFRVAPS